MRRGKTFILCGPSGVGKGTVVARLLASNPTLYFSVSATTRLPRPGEQDGVHYHFLSREQFQQWIDEDAFLEHAEFVGNCYGTPKLYVDRAMEQGRDVILDIEIQGADQVHRKQAGSGPYLCGPSQLGGAGGGGLSAVAPRIWIRCAPVWPGAGRSLPPPKILTTL